MNNATWYIPLDRYLGSVREQILREPPSHAERAAILGAPRPTARPATPAPAAAVSVAFHRRAVEQDQLRARAVAIHEAGHAVVGTAEGLSAEWAGLTYGQSCLTGAAVITGGNVRFEGGPVPAATAIAGLEAARLFGLEAAVPRDCHAGDESLERAAIGYDWTARKQATRYARVMLNRHAVTVAAVSAALLDRGVVEGAELERLMAPVRQRAA